MLTLQRCYPTHPTRANLLLCLAIMISHYNSAVSPLYWPQNLTLQLVDHPGGPHKTHYLAHLLTQPPIGNFVSILISSLFTWEILKFLKVERMLLIIFTILSILQFFVLPMMIAFIMIWESLSRWICGAINHFANFTLRSAAFASASLLVPVASFCILQTRLFPFQYFATQPAP